MAFDIILAAGGELTDAADPGIGFDQNDTRHGHLNDIARPPVIGTIDIGQR